LFLDIILCAALLCFADIVLFLSRSLLIAVTGQASDGTTNGSCDSVADTRGEVVELALGFLGFALSVLSLAFLFKTL
jgi:hypothetical protein